MSITVYGRYGILKKERDVFWLMVTYGVFELNRKNGLSISLVKKRDAVYKPKSGIYSTKPSHIQNLLLALSVMSC